MFEYLILIRKDFCDFMSLFFSLILVSIEKIYHTQISIYHIYKNLEVRQKYDAMRSIFNPLSVFENAVKYGLTVKVT